MGRLLAMGRAREDLVGMGRFELPTSPTRKERSTKLSHIPTEDAFYRTEGAPARLLQIPAPK